jgi:hypothetical protein
MWYMVKTRALSCALLLCASSLVGQVQMPDGAGGWKDAEATDYQGTVVLGAEGNDSYWVIHDENENPILRIAKDPKDDSVSDTEKAALDAAMGKNPPGTVTVNVTSGATGPEVNSVL